MYPTELIEEIRIQNDITDVISEYIQLKRKGSSYFGLCPFHNEKSPSFSVSPDKQMFYCFGCGTGGNVYTFVMEIENYNFVEAVKYLADRAHIDLPEPEISEEAKKKANTKQQLFEIHRETAKYFYYHLHSSRGQTALQYLNNRKIEDKTKKIFGLGYANMFRDDLYKYLLNKNFDVEVIAQSGLVIPEKRKGGYFDRFWNRVMFPIFDVHNRIIGFGGRVLGEGEPKYLNSPETLLFDKGNNLYGLNLARTARKEQILIVEGYMDVISLYQAGFENVVASLGTAFTSSQARLLKRYTNEVILLYDSDEAGIRAALRAIPILESNDLKIKALTVPGKKDPDEYINNNGTEAFAELLTQAVSAVQFEVNLLRKKYDIRNTDEKIRFTVEVAERLARLDNDIERDAYIGQIAQVTNISSESIKSEIGKIKQIHYVNNQENKHKATRSIDKRSKSGKSKELNKGLQEAQKNILILVTSYPTIYHKLREYIQPDDFTDPVYKRLASLIYKQYSQGSVFQPAMLMNHFEELAEQKKVSDIFNSSLEYHSGQEKEKAINDQVKLLKKAYIEQKSKTISDLNELQSLIQAKRDLESLHISLMDG